MTSVIFVTHRRAINAARGGGLQICTDELLRTFRAAGFDVVVSPIEHDRRLTTRVRRRLGSDPYPPQWEPRAVSDIVDIAAGRGARWICLNLVNLAPLAAALRPRLSEGCRIALMSHGLESVDYLHTVPRTARSGGPARELGRRLLQERAHRDLIDHVFCLTPYEAEIERWLGGREITVLPRTALPLAPLEWAPDPRRLGFVGTLDHPPTWQGMTAFLEALAPIAPAGVEVRVVGGPENAGRDLVRRFAIVRYLGPLEDDQLRAEAASWSAFLHPLFCWARGCSTKLAVALAWQLPIVTTPAGARGYEWGRGDLAMARSPGDFAALACRMTGRAFADIARAQAIEVSRTMPTVTEVGARIRRALTADPLERRAAWA